MMLCASCGRPDATTPCAICGADPSLDGRFRLEVELGRGAQGVVFAGVEVATGRAVAVKELPVSRHVDALAVLDREARVLREIDHPAVPAFVDVVAARGAVFLVRAHVEGESLEAEAARRRYTEEEVLGIVEELLGVLAHLHALRPPVVHRDLKPGNVIRRGDDGRLMLIDFGSVSDTLGASTVRGTFGYMAPEQFAGQASAGTDIYAVGAIAVALLGRVDPATLMDWRRSMRWRERVLASAGTARLLDRMLEPDPSRRAGDAAALAAQVRALRAGRDPFAPKWRRVAMVLALVGSGSLYVATRGVGALDAPVVDRASVAAPAPVATPAPVVVPAPVETPSVAPPEPPPIDVPGPLPEHTVDVEVPTGVLVPRLSASQVRACAFGELLGLQSAELSNDAAFDAFVATPALQWQPTPGCRWHVAFQARPSGDDFDATAVVTRGTRIGDRYTVGRDGVVTTLPRWSESMTLAEVTAANGWIGNLPR